MSHKHYRDHLHAHRCHVCRERDMLTRVAGGFAYLCRHCISDPETLARLVKAAREAQFEPEKQASLF